MAKVADEYMAVLKVRLADWIVRKYELNGPRGWENFINLLLDYHHVAKNDLKDAIETFHVIPWIRERKKKCGG